MAIIIEDGTGKSDAQSYATVAELDAFVAERGLSLTAATEAAKEYLLIKAADYLESFRDQYRGTKYDSTQALQWPRTGATLDGFDIADNSIPDVLKNAQIQLAIEVETNDLQPTHDGTEVVREKVGPLETQFAERGRNTTQKVFEKANDWLAPLLANVSLIKRA